MDVRNLVVLVGFVSICHGDIGFILTKDTTETNSVEVCSEYNPSFAPYAKNNTTNGIPVLDIYPSNGCDPPGDPKSYENKIIIMKRHKNCTFTTRAKNVQNANGKGVIVVSEETVVPGADNDSVYDEISITVSVISNLSYEKIHNFILKSGIENVLMKLYAPVPVSHWDPNALIMWALAVFTCGYGAWSQGSTFASEVISAARKPTSEVGTGTGSGKKQDEVTIGIVHALIFFLMCSVSILLMYFFYEYLVYVIIAIFCIASCLAAFDFFGGIFKKSPCFTRYKLPANRLPVLRARPPILSVVLFLCCAFVSVFWAVNRKEPYAWFLQDVLGFMFCVHMIKQIRLPNYKISSILLILFFVYDIFYVFITPLLTSNNESIMVNIATGGGGKSTEELPMLFKLPRFRDSVYSKCAPLPYSLLGYGDIILPGLHVGFCAVWDHRISNTVRRHIYFLSSIVGYGIGLILTFVGMYLMQMGQPALLYLAPSCLLSTLIVALKRKELKAIWSGVIASKQTAVEAIGENDTLLSNADTAI